MMTKKAEDLRKKKKTHQSEHFKPFFSLNKLLWKTQRNMQKYRSTQKISCSKKSKLGQPAITWMWPYASHRDMMV